MSIQVDKKTTGNEISEADFNNWNASAQDGYVFVDQEGCLVVPVYHNGKFIAARSRAGYKCLTDGVRWPVRLAPSGAFIRIFNP